jgi:pyrroline-5-carboxylate reductase
VSPLHRSKVRPVKIGFIGAGSMASGLARGLAEPAVVFDPDEDRARALADEVHGEVAGSNADLAERADLVVLGHKPPLLDEVADQVDGAADAVASIVAATPIDRLEAAYPGIPVYRLIPNIPVEVGRGVFGYAPGSHAADGPEQELLQLLGRVGVVVRMDEELLEPAMALMSCGPAFMAVVVEALAEAGAAHGLERRQATRLVVETMAGSAAYLDANDLDAGELRRRVATPGGLTEKGLGVLEEQGLPGALRSAVDLIVEASR